MARQRRRCQYIGCRRLFMPHARGRPPLYCRPACRAAAHRERLTPRSRRLVRLVAGDARAVLAEIPTGSIDLVLTDPPYLFDRGSSRFRQWFEMLADDQWPAVFEQLALAMASTSTAYVFCDPRVRPIFDAAALEAGLRVRTALVWDKLSPGLGAGWRAQYEQIGWYQKGQPQAATRYRGNVLRHPRVRGYPTEKPRRLLADLISQSSAAGDVVLDPFCGSGNVGAAAAALGRRAVLIDTAPEAAERRLRLSAFHHSTASPPPERL